MSKDTRSPAEQPHAVGDSVQAEWHGGWYAAEVREVCKGGLRVHYKGWGGSWDELVPLSRVRKPSAEEASHAGPWPAGRRFGSPPTAAPQGRAPSRTTPIQVGDRLQAEWFGMYWDAQVIAVEPNGDVRLRWDGWDSGWDETVPRSRLRVNAPDLWESLEGKPIRVHLDGGVALEGTLVEAGPDHLILRRSKGGARLIVARSRLLYCEADE